MEKARLDRQRIAEATKGVGKPKVGGKFALVDQEGNTFTDEDMKGGYSLVRLYFLRLQEESSDRFLFRSTLASPTARISALKSLTKWPI